MKKSVLQISILILMMVSSCKSKDCYNRSEIFDQYQSESKIYKDELAKQIKLLNPDQVTYSVDGYKKINNKEYINITIQAEGLCAKTAVLVNSWDNKIINIKQTQAKGYYAYWFDSESCKKKN